MHHSPDYPDCIVYEKTEWNRKRVSRTEPSLAAEQKKENCGRDAGLPRGIRAAARFCFGSVIGSEDSSGICYAVGRSTLFDKVTQQKISASGRGEGGQEIMQTLYLVHTGKLLESVGDASMHKYRTVLQYDAMKTVVAVQGILNRDQPQIYLLWEEQDSFWLEYMSRPGKLLCGMEQREISTYAEFLSLFAETIRTCGLVLWDEKIPATMNVATTVCGVEDMIPVRYSEREDSVLSMLVSQTGAKAALSLVGKFTGKGVIPDTDRPSSGSAKCDAYLWAKEKYMDRTNKTLLFYTVDAISWDENEPFYPDLGNAFVYNHDYAIAKRAFVFDVSSYDDEVPCDDPGQPLGTDYRTMCEILQHAYDRVDGKEMITVCGFNPWQLKYTDFKGKGKHGGVDAEWRFTEVLSAYNCIKDADAYGYCGLANASVYTKYPLKDYYENRRPKEDVVYDPQKTYVLLYVGDYDAAAWTYRFIPRWYRDPALGKNPLMWCFNPNLSDRIPQAFDFIYENYTQNDYFAAGDSGAGYNNPRLLYPPRVHSELPSGAETFVKHNLKYFRKFDDHIIGFVIDGDQLTTEEEMRDLSRFADVGVGYLSLGHQLPTRIINGTVFMPVTSDIAAENADPVRAARAALDAIRVAPKNKRFFLFRTILVSPGAHDAIMRLMREEGSEYNIEFTDPYTFFRFAKHAKENGLTF